ncbi:MAG: right-handed parallel beta-helix repeat-containing protein, partial [Kiritimatiellia bacterium]
ISTNGFATYQTVGSSLPAAAGTYDWDSTLQPSLPTWRWRVQCREKLDWVTAAERDFAIHNTNMVFYVNDASTSNDVFTAALGAVDNTGLTPDSPLPTLAAVLARYDLEPGDEVWIDTGVYAGGTATAIDYLDSGTDAEPVVIRGSPDSARTRFVGMGLWLDNTRGIHVQDLRFESPSGAAVSALSSDGLRVERTDVLGGSGDGVNVQYCSNTALRNVLVAYAATNGIASIASYDTRIEFGTIWSNGAAQVLSRNIPVTGGPTNYNFAFVTVSNSVMGAFGVRKPALEIRGNLFTDYNAYYLENGALAALSYVGGFGREFDSVGTWASSEFGQDGHSLSHDPRFADARNGDFRLRSQGGRWVPATGSWTNDDVSSPLIDAGDPLWACTEPDANGGRVNIGRYGNTAEASQTPTNGALTLISFNDGGRASGTDVEILWNSRGAITNGGTVSIWYSADGGETWVQLATGVAAADNGWTWDSTLSAQSVQGYLRIDGSDGSSAQSTDYFAVRNDIFHFYVNDESTAGDVYCAAVGSANNTGVSSNSPMLDLNALLTKYDLEGGDVVYIDTGLYRPSVPWRITQADSAGTLATNPVVFQGSTNSLVNGTVLVRNFGSVGIQADYAVGIRLRNIAVSNTAGYAVAFNNCYGASAEWMAIGVGNVGFYLNAGTQLGISNCVAFNVSNAVHVANWDKSTNTVFPVIQHNVFWETGQSAIRISGQNQATFRNNVLSVAPGQYVYELGAQDTLFADYNSIWLGSGGRVFRQVQSLDVSPVPIIYDTVGAWASASEQDLHSFDTDPLLVDVTNRVFQLRSRAGRWVSGTNWTADDVTSPLIDAGDPDSAAWANEPAPNGGRVNIGLYGGTPWASRSDTNSSLHLLTLNRGGVASGQVALNWTASGATTGHTVRLEVSLDAGATWPILVASGIPAHLGGVVWNSSGQPSSPLARWRVADETDPLVQAASELDFVLKNGPVYYYVNDESTTGDMYTDAIGNSTNSGASPASPKRWISEILETHNLEAGDVVYVDTGRYQTSDPTAIGDLDAGGIAQDPAQQVSIVGSTNRAAGGSRIIISNPESSAFQLDETYGIRLSHLDILGASNGLAINDSFFIGADWLTVQDGHNGVQVQGLSSNFNMAHSALIGNRNAGISFEINGMGAMDLGSSVLWSNRYGVYLNGGYLRTSNTIFGMVRPNSFGVYVRADAPVYGFQGDYNNLYVPQEDSAVGALQTGAGASARTSVYATVSAWALATGQEGHSLAHDPLLANPGAGDFHLLSRGGRYVPGSGWTTSDVLSSPLIDTGHPQSLSWTAETDPNGRRLNIGLYGGTAEASRTPLSGWITLISLNDGGSAAGTNVVLRWAVGGAATNDTVRLEYSPDNGLTWTNIVTGWPAATGSYVWNSVPYGRSALALWRATLESLGIAAEPIAPFIMRNGGTIPYYVNDAATAGDVYCTAVGDDSNHGYTPDKPKASLQAILDAYELAPEDVVYVDAGTYAAGSPPITITQTDSGWSNLFVTIQGSTNPAARTVFQSVSFSAPCVFSLEYAVNVRIKDLTLRGAVSGINAFQTIGCEYDGLRIENNRGWGLNQNKSLATRLVRSVLWNNGTATGGVAVALADSSIAIENSVLWGSLTAISVGSSTLTATNNVMEANSANGRIYQFGINASAETGFSGDYNSYYRRNGALLAEQALLTGGNDLYNNLPAWSALNGSDRHGMTLDPEFANTVNGDFHPKSPGGRYVAATGTWTNDAALSPLVDAGPADWPVGNEPSPNGNIVNLGAYGNTAQASMTQTNPWLRVVSYNDEGVMSGEVLLYWLHGGLPDDALVRLDYSTDYQLNWTTIASNLPAANREYAWEVCSLPMSLGLNWRVVYESNTNVWDASDVPVVLKCGTYEYYVNDTGVVGDVYTTGPGLPCGVANPTNPATPVDSLGCLFDNYPIGAGDTVYVDTGTYVLPGGSAVTIGDRNMGTVDAPLRIFGSTNFVAGGSRLVGNSSANGIYLLNTRHVELYDLRVEQAQNGVVLQNVSSARLTGMELFRNVTNGMAVSGSSGVRVENSRFWANRQYGYYCGGNGGDQILNSTFWGNGRGALRTGKAVTVSNSILSVTNAVPVYLEESDSASVSGDYNFYGLVPGAKIATNTFESVAYAHLSQWQVKGRDLRSVVADPLFVDPTNGNFHLQSRAGYWSNGTWAVSPDTSWAIDAGPAAPAVSNEPAPNGDRLNLGAFGGTFQASRSDTNNPGILPTTLSDGGTSADGQALYWLYRGLSPTNMVLIEYSPDAGATWRTVSDGWRIDQAPYAWYSVEDPSPEALWRVQVLGNTNVNGTTLIPFIFRPRNLVYYVNDDSQLGDVYTWAIGDAANKGYAPDSPLPSIGAVMDRFPLAPGDEIRVDTGSYSLSNGVVVTVLNSGNVTNPVTLRGSTNWAYGGSTLMPTSGLQAAAITLYGARYVNVANFRTMGFSNGLA